MSAIIIPGQLPAPKALCEKAKARGSLCTVDMCDHSGGYLALCLDGANFSDSNLGDCKRCGAPADSKPFFDAFASEYFEHVHTAALGVGPTYLIAGMRAYVASKFGAEVPDA